VRCLNRKHAGKDSELSETEEEEVREYTKKAVRDWLSKIEEEEESYFTDIGAIFKGRDSEDELTSDCDSSALSIIEEEEKERCLSLSLPSRANPPSYVINLPVFPNHPPLTSLSEDEHI
jgi:hypothetical protein